MSIRLPPNVTPGDTLLLRKVSAPANTVEKVFKHFKRFGRIHGIWCCGTEAMITFEKQEDCKAAFESPEAYANNRFVRFLYPEDADHAESKLSQFADLGRVMGIVEEVRAQMAEARQEANQLRSNMQVQQKQDTISELEEMVRDCEKQRDEFLALVKQLQKQLESSPDDAELKAQIAEAQDNADQRDEMIKEILKTRDEL